MNEEDRQSVDNLNSTCDEGNRKTLAVDVPLYAPLPKLVTHGSINYDVINGIMYGWAINFPMELYWVSDGYAIITEELRKENGDAVFTIEGDTKDGHSFKFEMDAHEFVKARVLKGKLTAQFGANNQVGRLDAEKIQQISQDVKRFRLVEIPKWVDGKAAVPGLDLLPDLRYATNSWIPVKVGGGNLSDAQQCLKDLLHSWDSRKTTIVLAAILGSPIVARWYPGDRFGLALTATTGRGKTEFVKHALAIYGAGYLKEDNLMKWVAGSTPNALMMAAGMAGFLPFLVDNYKPINKKDPKNLIAFIHATLEGSDKARLLGLKLMESLKFACTPIITGEDFPREPSTMARCPILDWSMIHNSDRLTRAQNLAQNLPALGKEWLTWLSENEAAIEDVLKDYETTRSELYKDILASSYGIIAGRLSTTLTLLRMIWKIALKCPALANVLPEFSESFEKGIDNLSKESPGAVESANEAEEFVSTLNELIATGRAKLAQEGRYTDLSGFVGWRRADGEVCIFPKTARKLVKGTAETTQELSSTTLYKQLDEQGYIKTEIKGDGTRERTLVRYFNGKRNRVLVFKRGVTS